MVSPPSTVQPAPELDDDDGLSSPPHYPSSLVPLETPRGNIRNPLVPLVTDEDRAAVMSFRHSFWSQKREAVSKSLSLAGASDNTRARFNSCGCNCWVLFTTGAAAAAPKTGPRPDNQRNITVINGEKRYRLASDRCRNRWCDACCVERRRTVSQNLQRELVARYNLDHARQPVECIRFLTLTLKANEKPLREQLDRLYTCWGKLRNHRSIGEKMSGGLAFLEIKRGKNSGLWHPHLHVLVEGQYLPSEQIKQHWLEITGDSFIVHIRKIRSVAEAAGYVAKYATKAVDGSVWQSQSHLVEAMMALAGRRTFNAFGSWRALSLSRPAADDLEWQPLAPLRELIRRARSGDRDSIEILRSLGRSSADEPIDGILPRATSPPVPHLS